MDVDRLLRLNARPMLQLADFVLDDLSTAEDAVEHAFVAAWRQRKALTDETAFRPWLRRMVLGECLRWLRHPMFRVLAITDRVIVQATATAESDAAAAVKRVSPSVRATIFLHLYEGLSLAQVASELRVQESSVKARLRQISGLESGILRYATERAGQISDNQADVLVSRAFARSGRRGWSRYLVNLASAVTLALVVIATGIVLQAQLHVFGPRAPGETSSGPLPPIPNEVVNLITASGDSGLVIPFRLRDAKALSARSQLIVSPGIALQLTRGSDCAVTTVSLVDPTTQKDVGPEVMLSGCIDTPVILPDGTVLLDQAQSPTANYFRAGAHVIRYDWRTGRVIRQYPNLALPLNGGLVSKDGRMVYTLDLFSPNTTVTITDLASGAQIVREPVVLADSGAGGGLALSTDQTRLFVNQGYQLASFDARSGAAGPVVAFRNDNIGAGSAHRWWLPTLSEAQAALDTSRGLAVDPRGRWVAAVGYNDPQLRGIWLISTSGRLHLIRRFFPSGALTGLAFSLDRSVLYAVDATGLLLFDPETGRTIRRFTYPTTVGAYGIAGVQAP
jgi:RNA polymerase sigma factor (sigma-70 family)